MDIVFILVVYILIMGFSVMKKMVKDKEDRSSRGYEKQKTSSYAEAAYTAKKYAGSAGEQLRRTAQKAVERMESADTANNPKPWLAVGRNSSAGSRSSAAKRKNSDDRRVVAADFRSASDYERFMDYCDSHVDRDSGITFHGLREGTDELAYLQRHNQKRERELERSLTRQSE